MNDTLAREILKSNFAGPRDVMEWRAFTYDQSALRLLEEALPSKLVLESLKECGYGLVPKPPEELSFCRMLKLWRPHFHQAGSFDVDSEPFAQSEFTSGGWLAMKMGPVGGSITKGLDDQLLLLSSSECVPSAVETAWFAMVFMGRNIFPFEKVRVRTASKAKSGDHVSVGINVGHSHGIDVARTEHRYYDLGLAARWKL